MRPPSPGRGLRSWLTAASLAVLVTLLPQPACTQQSGDGEAALREGRYEEAISALTRQASGSSDPQVHRSLVRALSEVGRYEEAEAVARSAVASVGAELANPLGEVLYLRGRIADAEEAFRGALTGRASDSLTAQLNLAVLLHDRGERAEALRRFDQFIDVYNRSEQLSSEVLTAVGTAVRYLGVNDPQLFKDALKAYDEAIAADPGNLEPRLRLGELFLEKYNSKDAQATFAEVLRLNPNQPRGLLGMAQAHSFDGNAAEAVALAQRSLQVNPNFVPARVFLARLSLEAEDYQQATREAERALAVNPASLEALSVLAATRYLQGERAGYEELRRRTLELNPAYAELYTTLGELAARDRKYEGAVELARQAVALDPTSWRAYGVLGLNQFRSGRIEEARRSLETAFTGDPYNVWIKNTLDLLDTFSRYETRRTAHFELMLHGQEAELLFPYAAELAEEAYEQLSAKYGYRPPTPIRIEVYPSHADFSVRTVGLAGLGALGAAFGNLLAMDSPSAREVGDFNWGSTLWHELAHVFALGLSEQRLPRWLSEGLAVLEERRARPGWGEDVSLPFLLAYQQGKLLPVSQLNRGFVRPQYPEQVEFSYYQASLVAEMIERDHGFGALQQMLRGYREGRTTEQLLASVLKTDPAAFDRRFDAYLRQRFAQPLAALRSVGRQGGAPSAADFAAQLTTGRRLFDEGKLEQAKPYLERAKALFPEYAADDSPYWYLASIHKQQGALRQAAEELAKLTALNENHYAAHLQLAELLESIGDAAGAAAALERAIYIYPFEIPLHTRLAALYTQLGERQKAVRERRAVVALRPVDRAEALYQLALAHLEAGETEAARREVLRALEEAPNFERAQELLLRLRSGSSGLGREGR